MEGNLVLFISALIASILSTGVSLYALRLVCLMKKIVPAEKVLPKEAEKQTEEEPKEFSLYLNKDGKYSYRVYTENKKVRDKKTPQEELHDVFDE